jgi:hypothetical protein
LHPRRQVRGTSDRRVFLLSTGFDRAEHHLSGVRTDSDLQRRTAVGPQLVGVAADFVLHPQRRIQGSLRMVFMRHGSAEDRKDAIARRLHHIAIVALHRIDHQLQRRIDDRTRLLGI